MTVKNDIHNDKILILDFGSQYTQLIARRIREAKVYSEIHPYNISMGKIKDFNAKGIILSGGPSSVHDKKAPTISKEIYNLGIPVLGVCYGMQLTTKLFGGKVKKSSKREFGVGSVKVTTEKGIFSGLKSNNMQVLMSHGDRVETVPKDFKITAKTNNGVIGAMSNEKAQIYGVQFHPEVAHTPKGAKLLKNFLKICRCKRTWTMKNFIDSAVNDIRVTVGTSKVVLGISGGVDSSVTAALVHRAIGNKLTCKIGRAHA